jgi:hypothetical protein
MLQKGVLQLDLNVASIPASTLFLLLRRESACISAQNKLEFSQEMPSTKMSAFLLHFFHLYSQSVRKIGSFWFDPSSFP